MNIEDLLIDFDEMGFAPTTICENPEEYAREWKKQLIVEIEMLKEENDYLKRTDEERYDEAEANIRAGIANGGTSCHWCEDAIRKNAVKEFAERLKEKLQKFVYDNEDYDGKVDSGTLYGDVIGIIGNNGEIISRGLIDELLGEYEK